MKQGDEEPTLSPYETTAAIGLEARMLLPVPASLAPSLPSRYRDLGPIGKGSFGEVRRVRDELLERIVAMKLLRAEYAGVAHVRRRFLVEAQITAGLQHPGIVAVYDRGELAGNRLWFTMKEVRGRTLGPVIAELHAHKTQSGFVTTPSGWTFRRVVDAFARIAQAIAYAHSRGVVHRDLKPDNLMVGEFGEVLVMDWGLALKEGAAPEDEETVRASVEVEEAEVAAPAAAKRPSSSDLTNHGDILGTPGYMAPEQARGDRAHHGPGSDVYSLGAVLHCVLTGHAPLRGSVSEVLDALLGGAHIHVPLSSPDGPPLPRELVVLCERALRPRIEDRPESADTLAAEVVAWLDGVRRREQALAALGQARALAPEITALRAQAEEAQARARALQADLRPFDPVEKKLPAWSLEDEAARVSRAAAIAETKWMMTVQGALSLDPDLPEAHAELADHHKARLLEAELAHRAEDAARAEELLRLHDRGRHTAFQRGDGALTLITDPPGAEVIVERYVPRERRLVPVYEKTLGPTPLHEAPLSRGSYLLRIRAVGRTEVRYPVRIDRAGHWDGRAPGDREPTPILLPREGEVGREDVYVPSGWCSTGGDPESADSLPQRRVWMGGFVIRRFPVTTEEYLFFLNDLVASGREPEALAACPRASRALLEAHREPILPRDGAGRFLLPPDRPGLRWGLDWPVVLVDWHGATAYVRWLAERTGQPFRLPDELEREKAARGVDGRFFPWGDYGDPTFACVADTSSSEASRESVQGHPLDESPYLARGLAGNVRDWCANAWRHEGPRVDGSRLVIEAAAPEDPEFRAIRGGAWVSSMVQNRAATRYGCRPGDHLPVLGLRVARSYGGP